MGSIACGHHPDEGVFFASRWANHKTEYVLQGDAMLPLSGDDNWGAGDSWRGSASFDCSSDGIHGVRDMCNVMELVGDIDENEPMVGCDCRECLAFDAGTEYSEATEVTLEE
ncbi:hypothetical protein FGB62_114g113 [Gracilaria domingensis]|nr:hypothetical protein FGB62_114g113 [Gracilaria domingensis]